MKGLISIVFIAVLLTSCETTRRPCVYRIPEGFTGWVLIEFDQTNSPPLRENGGKLIFDIGRDGRLYTSSGLETGWARDEYYIDNGSKKLSVSNWGGGGMIWGSSTGLSQVQGARGISYENFFVGTEEQFQKASQQPRP